MKQTTKRRIARTAALLLLAATIFSTACQKPSADPTESDSTEQNNHVTSGEADTKEEPMKPSRETYEDLSFQVPTHESPENTTVTVIAEGDKLSADAELDFSALSGLYIVSSTSIPNSHDSGGDCEICGYTELDGEGAFLLSSHGEDMGTITVTLATPIPASAVKGMTATLKTTANAPASQIRIMKGTETNNAAFINSCESMENAVDAWKTLDLGIADYNNLADTDGFIRSFQICFRNKNKCDCYLKSIRITVSPAE